MKSKGYCLTIVHFFLINFYLNMYIDNFIIVKYNLSNYILYFYRSQNPFVSPKLISYLKLLSFLHLFRKYRTHVFFHCSSIIKKCYKNIQKSRYESRNAPIFLSLTVSVIMIITHKIDLRRNHSTSTIFNILVMTDRSSTNR